VVLNLVADTLNIQNREALDASKCKIVELDSKTFKEFINENNLMKGVNCFVRLGLEYNNSIVSVMGFNRPSVAKGGNPNNDDFELVRWCDSKNLIIGDCFNYLLNYFDKNYSYTNLYCYGNKRFPVFDALLNSGFRVDSESRPNYWYVIRNYKNRMHRFSYRKNENDNPDLTEWENRQLQGYDRIWDCGSIKFIKRRNDGK
jgi:hypothetical protein